MKQIPTQIDGSTALSAADFNQIPQEEENAIQDAGQTLSGSDLFQLSKAMAVYAAIGDYYLDSGSTDSYILNQTTFSGSFRIRPLTTLFTGASIRFIPGTTNTGACTAAISGFPAKNIKLQNGNDPLDADLVAGIEARMYYNGTNLILINGQESASPAGFAPGDVKYTAIQLGAAPAGWLILNGTLAAPQNVSRTTYSNLFAAIGITWGAGDGITTFTLPPAAGQFLRTFDVTGTIDAERGGIWNGTVELDDFKSHTHLIDRTSNGGTGNLLTGTGVFGQVSTLATGGTETRGTNLAMYLLIKI